MCLLRCIGGRSNFVVFLLVAVSFFSLPVNGQPWAGSGTDEDPYQIWTAADMQVIGGSGYLGARFKLMADIDLSAYTGTSFNIIGGFSGKFDGNGHTISNFTYTSTGTNFIGLFRDVDGTHVVIKDLGLINPNVDAGSGNHIGGLVGQVEKGSISNCYAEGGSVSGGDNVGGLVGRIILSYGDITNCYSTASVSGTTNVGGLVGWNHQDGTVTNCYSEGSVSGDVNVGGLVGTVHPWAQVVNCYSTGSVSGSSNVGGLVGVGRPVCASFWDIQTSGQSTSGGGTGKTTAEMQTAGTFIGWGGCVSEGVWVLDEGNDYPRLWWENKPGQPLPTESLSDFVAGAGTEQDPYLIETGVQMNLVGIFWCEWNKHFKLTADIDLSAYTGTSFNIIGISIYEHSFKGTFDGNGHTISNFSYDSNNTNSIGMFSEVWGTIKDLGLINPNVDAGTGDYVGSLVAGGSPTGCYVKGGSVSGGNKVGGLVGYNGEGTMTNCSSNASVSGIEDVGGLVGYNGEGTMTNCSSTGSVSGTTNVGGLVGRNISNEGFLPARISSCYSTGSVSGFSEVGGLAGRNEAVHYGVAEVTNCYSTASVTGSGYVGGLVGRNTTEAGFSGVAEVTNCYSAGSVSGVTVVGGLLGYNERGVIADSFWDTETSGLTNMCGHAAGSGCDDWYGKTTTEMQMAITFIITGWDFVGETINGTDDFWDICEGTNYPKLVWSIPTGDFVCPDGVEWRDIGVLCEEWLFYEIPDDVLPDGGDGIVNFFDWTVFADGWPAENDMYDLAEFVDQWLKTGQSYLITDIAPYSGDGITNMADFAVVADNWLEGMF